MGDSQGRVGLFGLSLMVSVEGVRVRLPGWPGSPSR